MNPYICIVGNDLVEIVYACNASSFIDAANQAASVFPGLEILHVEQTDSVEEAFKEYERMLI